MRYMKLRVYPDWETFHPVEHRLSQEPDLRRIALHSIKLVDDGSFAVLAEAEGDIDRYRELLHEIPEVKRFAVSGTECGYCYAQMEPSESSRELVEARETEDFIIKMPMQYTDDGGLQVMIVGEDEDLVAASESFTDYKIELRSTGPYFPDIDGVFATLTERQREVLNTAIRNGYYEKPREATLMDLGDELGITPGTVGEHLRGIESKVFARFLP